MRQEIATSHHNTSFDAAVNSLQKEEIVPTHSAVCSLMRGEQSDSGPSAATVPLSKPTHDSNNCPLPILEQQGKNHIHPPHTRAVMTYYGFQHLVFYDWKQGDNKLSYSETWNPSPSSPFQLWFCLKSTSKCFKKRVLFLSETQRWSSFFFFWMSLWYRTVKIMGFSFHCCMASLLLGSISKTSDLKWSICMHISKLSRYVSYMCTPEGAGEKIKVM